MVTYLLDRDVVLKNIDPDHILPDWMIAYVHTKIMELPVHSTMQSEPEEVPEYTRNLREITIP